MGQGMVTARHQSIDAKLQRIVTRAFALTSASTDAPLLYDRNRRLVIHSIDMIYTVAPTATTTITIGTVADDDAIVTSYTTSSSASIGTTFSLPLATTLRTANKMVGSGKPVLPKNTVMTMDTAGVGSTGTVVFVISYYPLDDNYAW